MQYPSGKYECGICFEEKDPFMTLCSHSGCEECLKIIKECHICRKPFPKGFKPIKNIELLNFLDQNRVNIINQKKIKEDEEDKKNLYSTNCH